MVGDAPGDLKAVARCGALFFPINPGAKRPLGGILGEGIERFFARATPGTTKRGSSPSS